MAICCAIINDETSKIQSLVLLKYVLDKQLTVLFLQHTSGWWLGAIFSTLIPVIYAFTGGMRASIMTDLGQSFICIGFLIGLLIILGVNAPADFGTFNPTGTCSLTLTTTP